MSIQLNCVFKPCNWTLFQILSSVRCQTNLWLNEIYAYLRLWNSIHDLCKTNDNCILGVVSISKGMVSIFFAGILGTQRELWNVLVWCKFMMPPNQNIFNFFFLKKVVKYLIKDSAFKRFFISVKTPTVRNFSWYQTHVNLSSEAWKFN